MEVLQQHYGTRGGLLRRSSDASSSAITGRHSRNEKRSSHTRRRPHKRRLHIPNVNYVAIVRGPSVFPKRLECTLKFWLSYELNGLGAYTYKSWEDFKGNGMKPVWSAGYVPYGFDQLGRVYNSYIVYDSFIHTRFYTAPSDTPWPAVNIAVYPRSGSHNTPTRTFKDVSEFPNVKTSFIPANDNSQHETIMISQCSSPRALQVSNRNFVLNERDYSGGANSNPTNSWDWELFAEAVDRSSTINVQYEVTIWYHCVFYQLDQNQLED